jgi:predicted PurR-regulated permease PerM
VLVWLLAPILTPFVISALLGWLGDPMVDRLERAGRSRSTSWAWCSA